ncbi:uncharacterized protein LOC143054940 [Mytilus galloprovincialis]|uniref:uncharacterized protein LOC143054731 n=1 Tax=Mytilus galloprovincialis TaxID=29158 RepID=UPI003F7C1EA6
MDGARFNAFKVPQLQEYLKERGISVTNINKLKLTKLCEAVDKLNLPLDPDMRKNESVTSVKHNLKQLFGFCDPFSLDGYTSDLSFIPSFSLYDLFNYLIHSTASYDRRKLKAYKSSKDYRLYFDRYVEELQYTEVPSQDICVFKAKVKPTQKDKTYLNKATYDVWVIMDKKNGEVKTAYCTCIGGADGACRHVGATLYEIEAFEVKSVTDGENQWKKRPRSHDCPVPIK